MSSSTKKVRPKRVNCCLVSGIWVMSS